MAAFVSPGVYVQEVPSAVQPIAGVGTSTAGFIGIFAATAPPTQVTVSKTDSDLVQQSGGFQLSGSPVGSVTNVTLTRTTTVTVVKDDANGNYTITLSHTPISDLTVEYTETDGGDIKSKLFAASAGTGDGKLVFDLGNTTIAPPTATVKETRTGTLDVVKGTLNSGSGGQKPSITFSDLNAAALTDVKATVGYTTTQLAVAAPAAAVSGVALLTSFRDLTAWVSTFPGTQDLDFKKPENSDLLHFIHAVYGFFNNGGSSCYVVRATSTTDIAAALLAFESIDDIALVAAPGISDKAVANAISDHCKKLGDRFAILDSPETVDDITTLKPESPLLPFNSDYAAYYFPWIQVLDPFTKQNIYVPPSGHIAGIYARVDSNRGVHKAPANEVVLGALGLKYQLSSNQQENLNPQGVNAIRMLNGNIRVWGARTLGGSSNSEWTYINIRRLFLFLRESIDQGTQWAVFEPNDMALWAKITRNITAFLTNVWRAGALFGATPQQAFYVKCDAETNPSDVRDQGRVVTEIGVAVVKPAEFVIFRISQWAGPGQ
jgi:phage tail sheath protein FI